MSHHTVHFKLSKHQMTKLARAHKHNTDVALQLSKSKISQSGITLELTSAEYNLIMSNSGSHNIHFSASRVKRNGFLPAILAALPTIGTVLSGLAGASTIASNIKNMVQGNGCYISKYGDKVFGVINMQSHGIVSLPNPVNDCDAATKSYVDSTSYLYLLLIGGTVNGDLIVTADTATVRKLGCNDLGVNTGNLQLFMLLLGSNEERIQAVTNQPTLLFNTKGLMIVCNGNNVVKFGNSLTDSRTNFYQDVILNSNYITYLHDPTNLQDAATKNYADSNDNLRMLKAGDTMSGTLNMNNNSITNLSNPSNNGDAVNKSYVDARLNNSGLLINLTGATGNKNGAIVTSSSNYSGSYSAWRIWNLTVAANQPNNEWGTAGQVTNCWVMIQNVNAMLVWKVHLCGRLFETSMAN